MSNVTRYWGERLRAVLSRWQDHITRTLQAHDAPRKTYWGQD